MATRKARVSRPVDGLVGHDKKTCCCADCCWKRQHAKKRQPTKANNAMTRQEAQ